MHNPCPACNSSDAYTEYDDGHGYCFSCKTRTSATKDTNHGKTFTYEYLDWRGVDANTFRIYDCKTKVDESGIPIAVQYRYPNGSYKVRALERKEFWSVGDIAKAGLFGTDKFQAGGNKSVTITEGELDALSLYQVLRYPVVSVQSASSAVRDCTGIRSWLNSFERIYLCLDNDTHGLEAARRIASLFDYNKVYHVKLTKYKDANEYLVAGEGDALRQAWWAAKKYLPEEIVSSLSEFESILTELPKYGVPYPFPTLTSMTYGIRPGETILFTAQEGVGKTEMMHAIEYNILKETEANVGAIFLEEPKRRHLQALAGIELSRPAHLPDSGCSPVQITTALKEVVAKDERLYLYSHFGSNDPEVLLDTIRFMASSCGCRFILFDHISMAVSGLAGDDERKALDYLSTRLEMMVKELDFALLLVSHVNDHGDTRGSRYISKVCDIRVDLSRDVKGGSNVIDLVVSKNRFCGKTGPAGKIVFDPITYTLSEDMLDVQATNDNQEQSPKETVWETNLRPAA